MKSASSALSPGSVLGRYELLAPIAEGGMATVWAARMKGSRGFSKIVAIKTMLPALSEDPRFEKMFLSEAELASRIKHPNVCEILDLGEEDRVVYIVMEWIDGDSLSTLLADCRRHDRTVPYAAAARIALEAAKGLHAAHELKNDRGELVGVVHRDVSPQNILVTPDGVVKIVDFGVAKATQSTDHVATNAGQLKGKVHFMAPEQVYGDEIDRRTDIFALGIVLYYVTTGVHPFRGDNELATLARITSLEPVEDPCSLDPAYPPELSQVVRKALAKEAKDRFASMQEFVRALEPVVLKLSAEGEGEEAARFVSGLLEARASARREALTAARASSVSLVEVRASQMELRPSQDLLDPAAGRARNIAVAGGLIGIGAVLGAALLLWVRGDAPKEATSSVESAPQVVSSSAAVPSVATASAATSASAEAAPSASAAAPKGESRKREDQRGP